MPFDLPLKRALHSDIQIQASTWFLKLLVCKITSEEIIMKVHFRTAILPWFCSWLRFKKPSEWIQTIHSSNWKNNHVVNHLLYLSSYLITYSGLCSFSVYLKKVFTIATTITYDSGYCLEISCFTLLLEGLLFLF